MPKGNFNFMDEIPEGFVVTKDYTKNGVHVREWRNPNLDPEERQRRLDDIGQFLWECQCRREAQKV